MTEKAQQKIRGFWDMQQPLSKTQPAEASDYSKGDLKGDKNTEHRDSNDGAHTFNYKGKVTSMGGNYMEFGKSQAGLGFNANEKDASMEYLKSRNMKGQEVRNFSSGHLESKMTTGNGGVTAYNGMPITEVYTPATSNKVPSGEPVIYPATEKQESQPASNQADMSRKLKK